LSNKPAADKAQEHQLVGKSTSYCFIRTITNRNTGPYALTCGYYSVIAPANLLQL